MAFHWSRGIYFERLPNGDVKVWQEELIEGKVVAFKFSFIVPAHEWCSIIASVSAQGETTEKWEESKKFHGVI